ncbi:MAG: ribonuclease R [Gemmatimonadales bacterium]|nr:MAG: ribonuclease R [Gemmatimonadales bacterium]
MSKLPETPEITNALSTSDGGPLDLAQLADALGVPGSEHEALAVRLRKLEREGTVYRNRKDRYALPSQFNLVIGELSVTGKGDGFVRDDHPDRKDVFVRSADLDSALHGDRVAVRVERRPRDRNPEGRVVKVVERGRASVVGRYHEQKKFGFVRPLDLRLARDVVVRKADAAHPSEGDVVVVDVEEWGSPQRNAIGSIRTVLGPMDSPGVDVLAILHGHGLPEAFPPQVEEAAAEAARRMDEPGNRTDCRDLTVVTIDPADARDHDDALSLEELDDGRWEVGIHIADVSHFVEEGSLLDREALDRGTSVYLVDQVVPMLPHLLSSDLCSLREQEDRLALSLFVKLDDKGKVGGHRVEKTRIRTTRGLSYEKVQEVLDGSGSVDPSIDAMLRELAGLSRTLRGKRRSRGSLDFDLPEARVVLDSEGAPIEIRKVVQMESHRLVEDFMLLANEVVAGLCEARELPVPYRVHEPPPKDRRELLETRLAPFGYSVGGKGLEPSNLQRIIEAAEGKPEESLISAAILRSMSRARYDETNLGHFGLASEAYAHFTSPIRRYPDLWLHRVLSKAVVEGASPPGRWQAEVASVAEHTSEREGVAQQAERDSVDMKKIEYMGRHLGEEFEGTISGVTSFGFFVTLDRVFVDGLVHVSTLDDDYYSFVEEAWALVGKGSRRRFRLGDRVTVQVTRADKEERKIDFLLLKAPDSTGHRSGGGPDSRKGKGGSGSGGAGGGRKKGGKGRGGKRRGGKSGRKSGRKGR